MKTYLLKQTNELNKLNDHLGNIEYRLTPIASAAQLLIESGLLEKLTDCLPDIISLVYNKLAAEEPKLFMADVIRYLGISQRSYYRKVAAGKLTPRKWEGPDYFYPSDLAKEWYESKRRGRV